MARYDSVHTPVPLPDFRRLTPGNWSSLNSEVWDPTGLLAWGSETLIDGCLHDGLIHVAWVEYDSSGFARGPFCSYWDGASWNALGGEIEASLTGCSPFYATNLTIGVVDGARRVPARVNIASDGDSIYVGYTIHVSEPNPYDPARLGLWNVRKYAVSRWDGASWSLFGEIDALTFNAQNTSAFGSNQDSAAVIDSFLTASESEPGVCYAGFTEEGFIPKLDSYYYYHGGDTHMKRRVVVKMDGATITTKTIAQTTATAPPAGFGQTAPAMHVQLLDIINDAGTPWILEYDYTAPPATPNYPVEKLVDWNSLVAAQTLINSATPGTYAVGTFGPLTKLTPDPARDVYYTRQSLITALGTASQVSYLAEFARDGSEAWGHLDDLPPIGILDGSVFGGDFNRGCPESRNIWFLRTNYSSSLPGKSELWQYHRQCRGWTRTLEFAVEHRVLITDDVAGPVGNTRLLLIGESLYVVAMVVTGMSGPSSGKTLMPRVYKIDICRECNSCGAQPVAPAIGIYRSPRITDDGTGMPILLLGALGGSATTSNLYDLDSETGAATPVGPLGVALTALAWDPIHQKLYGATSNNSTSHKRSLMEVDIASGAATLIGAFGVGAANSMADLACDSAGNLYGIGSNTLALYSINKATGAATLIGGFGLFGGIAFDRADNLLLVTSLDNFLNKVDPATGNWPLDAGVLLNGYGSSAQQFNCFTIALDDFGYGIVKDAAGAHLVRVNIRTGFVENEGPVSSAPPLDALSWYFNAVDNEDLLP